MATQPARSAPPARQPLSFDNVGDVLLEAIGLLMESVELSSRVVEEMHQQLQQRGDEKTQTVAFDTAPLVAQSRLVADAARRAVYRMGATLSADRSIH